VLKELDAVLDAVEQDLPKGLVIRSAKPGGFIAGADISEFGSERSTEEVQHAIKEGHRILDRLEALACPTVAVIHGYALGGGLELALACDHRLAIDGAKLGFPEVMLGLHPGLGGTARATELIDPTEAMTLMLTGKPAHTRKAKTLGLVDAVIEERHVGKAVQAAISGKLKKAAHGIKDAAFNTTPGRHLAARRMRAETAKRAPEEQYPAPYRLIDLWEEHGGDAAVMKAAEIVSFAELLRTPTAQNLIRVFFLREGLKRQGSGDHRCDHVHVVGAGAMGGDIAAWCALQGFRVTLGDVEPEPIGKALAAASKLAERRHLKPHERTAFLDRLIPDVAGVGIRHADLVIEAVPEKIELKHKVYRELEAKMKEGALLATNTSSIPLAELIEGLQQPGRLVGLHFFNPVAKMQLVEVVRHERADDQVVEQVMAFTKAIDRLPVAVTSAPGFLVNRVLMPYLLEAVLMLEEGIDKGTIDLAAERFGMPMGPIELADRVGLDVCLDVADMLKERLDQPLPDVPPGLRKAVENGDLGAKTGRGLYHWKDGEPEKHADPSKPDDEMTDRLILPMVNTAVRCHGEGVVGDADRLDAAMIFGAGFAPFRGGPLHYARTRGADDIVATLNALAERHGDRFAPAPEWTTFDRPADHQT
jgi:3-hydroxyacyl-CoA dehydrogenase/enoyl-CoA hydratase/3-hydroxybutyryl-CoA epimerase